MNYNKKQITGKRMHLILSLESHNALKKKMEELGLKNTTKYIETLLLLPQKKEIENTNKVLDKCITLTNFNKKLYIDLNATFSNVNQIAYKLNFAHLTGELSNIIDKNFQQEVKNTMEQTSQELKDLRIVIKKLIANLENKEKELQPYTHTSTKENNDVE